MVLIKRYSYYFIFLLAFPSAAQAMDPSIFDEEAFMQSSLRADALQPRTRDFERLEFLGDRVLGLITAHMLYKEPSLQEENVGEMAKLYEVVVSKPILARMYYNLHIDSSELSSYAYCAPTSGLIAEKTASDIVESLVGALYKAKGFEKIQEPLEQFIRKYLNLDKKRANAMTPSTPIKVKFRCPGNLETLQQALGYQFSDPQLLHEAFKHSSVGGMSFKKLDFLGVRVLALAIADHVFTDYQSSGEGILTQAFERSANNSNLEKIFHTWQLGNYLKIQSGGTGVSTRMATDTVRSLMGAVYLDGGWKSASAVTHKFLFSVPPPHFIEGEQNLIDIDWAFIEELFRNLGPETTSDDEIEECPLLKSEEETSSDEVEEFLTLMEIQELARGKGTRISEMLEASFPPLESKQKFAKTTDEQTAKPDFIQNEPLDLKKKAIWQDINDSQVKKSMPPSKTLMNTKERKTVHSPKGEWPTLANNAPTNLSKTSVWKKVNDSSMKKPEAQSRSFQHSSQTPSDVRAQKSKSRPQEVWPSLMRTEPSGEKSSIWDNINESTIKQSQVRPKNVQSFPQPPSDAKTQKTQSPPREVWPSLSDKRQRTLRK
jgi:dsRNA-specific ribonuclease